MKKIITFLIVLSIVMNTLFVFSGCDKDGGSTSPEYTATQEELLKENNEIKKLLNEKNVPKEINDVGTYKFRLMSFDKVDNKYTFEKGQIEEFYTTYPYDGFIVKTKDGYYAWGNNSFNSFTTNERDIIRKRIRVDLLNEENHDITKGVVKYFVPEEVTELKLSNLTTRPAGLTKDGKICLWGDSDDIVSTSKGVKYVESKGDKIIDFVRKKGAIYYLTSKGEMYTNEKSFGENEHPTKEIYDDFFKISENIKIEKICEGSHRQLVVKDKNGDYYVYEYNKDKNKYDFKKMKLPEKIIKVESAFEITFFLSESGNIYGYGKNGAQFYEGNEYRNINMEKLELGFKVKDMNIDQVTAFFIDYTGNLYGIGYEGGGALFKEETTTDETLFGIRDVTVEREPVKIDIPDKVIEVKNNYVNGICKTQSGDIYVFGNNLYGSHLDGTRWSTYKPTKITK